MAVHSREQLDRISRLARREFSHALMSDTKWRKMFGALADADIDVKQIIVKFIDASEETRIGFPPKLALCCPKPYIDLFEFGPIELRSIEWLEIPSEAVWARANNVPARRVSQDLSATRTTISRLGQFPIEETARGLRINGYLR